jgi:hypothetical protein
MPLFACSRCLLHRAASGTLKKSCQSAIVVSWALRAYEGLILACASFACTSLAHWGIGGRYIGAAGALRRLAHSAIEAGTHVLQLGFGVSRRVLQWLQWQHVKRCVTHTGSACTGFAMFALGAAAGGEMLSKSAL